MIYNFFNQLPDWKWNIIANCPLYRSAAYNLLCALTCTFNLKIEGQLLETSGLCIPANNTLFIVSISKTLAANEPHLTLEFLEECISGFSKSSESRTQMHRNTHTHKCID